MNFDQIEQPNKYTESLKEFEVQLEIFTKRTQLLKFNNDKIIKEYKIQLIKHLEIDKLEELSKLVLQLENKNLILQNYLEILNFDEKIFSLKIDEYTLDEKTELSNIFDEISNVNDFSHHLVSLKNKIKDLFVNFYPYKYNWSLEASKIKVLQIKKLAKDDVLNEIFDSTKNLEIEALKNDVLNYRILYNLFKDVRKEINDYFKQLYLIDKYNNTTVIKKIIDAKKLVIENKILSNQDYVKRKKLNYVNSFIYIMETFEEVKDLDIQIQRLKKPLISTLNLELDEEQVINDSIEYFNYALLKKFQRKVIFDGTSKNISLNDIDDFIRRVNENLYVLTQEQRDAIYAAFGYLNSKNRVNCLIQGDVSSGKTIVSIAIFFILAKNNYKSLYIVPRKALKLQHVDTLNKYKKLLKYDDIQIKHTEQDFSEADIVVGGYSTTNRKFDYFDADVAIIDEIQLLGIENRNNVQVRYKNIDMFYTTATPHPRTKIINLIGEMDIIEIREMPPGRKPKLTQIFSDTSIHSKMNHDDIFNHINEQLNQKQTVIVVSPKTKKEGEYWFENVFDCYKTYATQFPNRNVKMLLTDSSDYEKSEVLNAANNNKIDIIVTTKLIEVGIDIKTASTIIIYPQEKGFGYGVSTLHQMRGRVGRGNQQGYCYIYQHGIDEEISNNVKTILETEDVFEITQRDLDLRGIENIIGFKQSGTINSNNKKLNQNKIDKYKEISKEIDFLLKNLDEELKDILVTLTTENIININ